MSYEMNDLLELASRKASDLHISGQAAHCASWIDGAC